MDAIMLAFIRFSCRFGYPKVLMPDEGSQLECQDMTLSFGDINRKMSVAYWLHIGAYRSHLDNELVWMVRTYA